MSLSFVAGLGAAILPGGFLILYLIKKLTKQQERVNALERVIDIKDEQLRISSLPTDDPDTILRKLREDAAI